MKRFIKTKDGIYDETKACLIADAITSEIFVEKMIDGYTSHLEKVIAQADTPEELCDLFIDEETKAIFHKHNGYVINWRTNLVYSLKGLVKEFHSIKGAIWTSKGLIYVAKMNEKGELELL